jgi:predicted nucleic acid-binding protein
MERIMPVPKRRFARRWGLTPPLSHTTNPRLFSRGTFVDLVFLDANILFSAAYRPDAGLKRLWKLPGARMITSAYAIEEAYRNLDYPKQRKDLEDLLGSVEVIPTAASTDHPLFSNVKLPDKDRPIPLAAIGAGATHLLNGDFQHFGPYYGERVLSLRRESTSL